MERRTHSSSTSHAAFESLECRRLCDAVPVPTFQLTLGNTLGTALRNKVATVSFDLVGVDYWTPYDVVIDWGDGQTSSYTDTKDTAVVHTYSSTGTFTVTATAILSEKTFSAAPVQWNVVEIPNLSMDLITDKPASLRPGQALPIVASLANTGNATAKGPATIYFVASDNDTFEPEADTVFSTKTVNLNLRPGRATSFRSTFRAPKDLSDDTSQYLFTVLKTDSPQVDFDSRELKSISHVTLYVVTPKPDTNLLSVSTVTSVRKGEGAPLFLKFKNTGKFTVTGYVHVQGTGPAGRFAFDSSFFTLKPRQIITLTLPLNIPVYVDATEGHYGLEIFGNDIGYGYGIYETDPFTILPAAE